MTINWKVMQHPFLLRFGETLSRETPSESLEYGAPSAIGYGQSGVFASIRIQEEPSRITKVEQETTDDD